MTEKAQRIVYWNREKKCEETEKVYGNDLLLWAYGTKTGNHLLTFLTQPSLSRMYGWYQSSPLSRHKINRFIQDFSIPMHEFVEGPFQSFNDFFIRHFRPGMRPFTSKKTELAAFAEARYLGFDKISEDQTFPVKGIHLNARELLGNETQAKPFMGGPLMIARLCPVDYHRFHFPDDGSIVDHYTVSGLLHSVNPVALKSKSDILITNERQVTILQTQNFGKIAYIEVGAMMVGKIIQTHKENKFQRGDEKGYFLFGGSTVIVLGEPQKWKPSQDILKNTQNNRETFIKLGDVVGSST